jgi:hypothetical protein
MAGAEAKGVLALLSAGRSGHALPHGGHTIIVAIACELRRLLEAKGV